MFFKKGIFVFQTEPNSIDRSIASNPKKNPPTQIPKKHSSIHCLLLASTRKKKFPCFFPKKIFFFHPRPGFELTLKRSWFPPQRAPSARRCRRFPARARARRRRRRCCCPPTPPSHRIGIGKKRGVSNLGIDKNPIGIKPLYEPQPFEPATPFFSTNWSAVSHPSQRVIPLRHVSVTKCPLFADLSPRSPFPRPVSGFPNKNT